MWVIVVLLLVGGTIVCVRLFRNGALEDAEFEASESPTPESLEPPAPVKTRIRATSTRPAADATATAAAGLPVRRTRSKDAPAASSAWPGGDCPACGSPTVRAAKFCGECGRRLIADN